MSQDEQDLVALLAHFYLQNGRPAKAENLLTALDIMVPDIPATLAALAFAQIRANHEELALETLDRLAMLGEIDTRFHLMRMQALSALNRTEEAEVAKANYLAMRNAPATEDRPGAIKGKPAPARA